MRYEKLSYGEVHELVDWCREHQPELMVFPFVGNAMVQLYNTAAKKTHTAKLDNHLLSDLEMLKLKFLGLDDTLVEWKRWYGIKQLIC